MSKDYPDDLRFTKDHEWARLEGTLVTVGVSSFAVESLGDVTMVDLPQEGDVVKAGDPMGSVESVKAVSDIYAPVSGRVVKVNDPLRDAPETLNEDCYDEGWLVQIELKSAAELEKLMSAEQYEAYLKEEE